MPVTVSDDRSSGAAVAFLALGIAVVAAWFLLPAGPSRAVAFVGFNALAVVAMVLGVRRHRPTPVRPWLVLIGAQTASIGAYACWYLRPTLTGVPLEAPSLADAFFLGLYGLSCLAVGMLVRSEGAGRDRRTFLDVLVVAVSLGALAWVHLMAPYAADAGIGAGVRLLSLAYPTVDLLLFVLTVRLVISGATPTAAKWLLLAWSGCQLTGDAIYGFELLAGRWSLDSPVPSLWMAGFAFVGAAALHPSIRQLAQPARNAAEQRRAVVLRTGLVLACSSVLPVVLVVGLVRGDVTGLPVIAAGSFVVFVIALLRASSLGSRRADSAADRRSVVRLVAAFTVLALLPLGLLALTSVRLAEQALEQDVISRLETTASASAALIERQVGGVGELVSSYAQRRLLVAALTDGRDATHDRSEVARHLEQLQGVGSGVVGALVTDGSGRVTQVVPEVPGLVGEDLSDRDWYRGVVATDRPYVSSSYLTPFTGDSRVIAVAAPVRAHAGDPGLGYLVAIYDLVAVQELADELAGGHGVELHITDQDGAVVAAPAGHVLASEPEHEGMVWAEEPVDGLGWTVTTEVSRDEAFLPLARLRSTVLGIATLLGQALLGGLVMLMRSLRDRREAERTLQRSEQRTRQILDAAADAYLSIDADGAVTAWSPQAERLFGWTADEVRGRPADEFVLLQDRLRPALLGERNEAVAHDRDGRAFPVEFVMWASGSGDDAVLSAFVHDISERRHQEAEVAAARDQALEASRMKSEFLAVVSHEIRTPMNGVLGMTSLLLATGLDEEQREYAETIRDSGEHLLTLVNDVLDLSKAESGRMTLEVIDFSLRHVVRDVTDLLGVSAADRGIDLVTDVAAGVPMALRGDPGRLRQILTNLLGNAIKFTAEGSVALTIGAVTVSDTSIVLRFEVTDTGIGLADGDRQRLFESFAQADSSTTRQYGGTGLGLAISRQLVELLDGEIGVRSRLGEGSTFWFTATFAPGVPLRPLPAVELPAGPVTGGRSALVLVAEDNAVNQKIAARMLEKLGHRADVVANGVEAVEAMRRVPYDLVLMDCQMPVMDGYTATATIREAAGDGARTPVVAMTASAMEADRQRCLAAGMDDYLSKPVRLHDLAAAVARWVPASGPEPAHLDEAVMENLADLGPGIVAQVVEMFLAGLPGRVDALRAAVDAGDAGALAGLAHGLRGTSGNVGGSEVAATCARIETTAVDDQAAAAALVPELERQLAALSAALTRYVAEPVR